MVAALAQLAVEHRQAHSPEAIWADLRAGLANIATRLHEVGGRDEVGRWEIDEIIGARNRSSLLTFTERVTR